MSPLSLAAVVPATVLFVLTARPARLYAESSSWECSSPFVTSCEGLTHGARCGEPGNEGYCQPVACYSDAGVVQKGLLCSVPPVCVQKDRQVLCDGKVVGQACGETGSGDRCTAVACPFPDGGPGTQLACEAPPDAASSSPPPSSAGSALPSGEEDSEGCNAAGNTTTASGVAFGLILAVAAFIRRARAMR